MIFIHEKRCSYEQRFLVSSDSSMMSVAILLTLDVADHSLYFQFQNAVDALLQ